MQLVMPPYYTVVVLDVPDHYMMYCSIYEVCDDTLFLDTE